MSKHDPKRRTTRRVLLTLLLLLLAAALIAGGVYLAMRRALGALGRGDAAPQSSDAPAAEETGGEVPDETGQLPTIDPDTYYAELGEVVAVTPVEESDAVRTEKDVRADFTARGFEEEITTPYSMGGKYLGDAQVTADSTQSHPVYEMYFRSSEEVLWYISEVNGVITAQPLTYLNENHDAPILLAEGDSVTAYDSASNAFYEIVPTGYELKPVDRIDFETLDGLTLREVVQL